MQTGRGVFGAPDGERRRWPPGGRSWVGIRTVGERPPPPRPVQVVIDRRRPAVERASVGRSAGLTTSAVGINGQRAGPGRAGLTTSTRTHT